MAPSNYDSASTSRPYVHGHHESALKFHATRTAANSCAYLLPYIKPTDKILDIGCGPGSITLDLANHVPEGSTIGIDIESARSALEDAGKRAEAEGKKNAKFAVGDVFNLHFDDGTFDVVHAHQVVQHVPHPEAALKEMRRVCRVGGFIAFRDVASFLWYPEVSGIQEFFELFKKVAAWTGGTPGAGSQLKAIARKAGFSSDEVVMQDATTWNYATPESIQAWCATWIGRLEGSNLRANALDSGLATEDDLKRLIDVWKAYGEEEDAWFTLVHGEIILRKQGA
jgi:ubiquinone/menaquinone biosynthesis C-methylase UbiE